MPRDFRYWGLLHHWSVTVNDNWTQGSDIRVQISDMDIDMSQHIDHHPTDYELEQIVRSILYEREDINKDYWFSYRDCFEE